MTSFITVLYTMASIFSLTLPGLDGKEINLADFKGKKILLVNTASQSALAGQLGELQQLQDKYQDKLVVFWQMDGTLDREGGFWKSFSRGALSAMTAKGISKSFLKGAGIKADPDWAQNWYTQGGLGGVEKGTQTVFSNYNKYGPGAAKKFGRGFYGQLFLAGFAGGFIKGAGAAGLSKWEEKLNFKSEVDNKFNFSIFSIGAISIGSDHTKKVVAKSLNKEYKRYLSKSSGFDTPSIMNSFFQMVAYSAGK